MSKLREAAQAVINRWYRLPGDNDRAILSDLFARLRAALAQPESRPCTCHPDDNPPQPCAQRYALTECKALAQPETEAGVSWGGHSVRGDADSIAEVRRLIDFEQARQGTKPATGGDLRVYDAIAANYNAQPEPEPVPVVIGPEWTPCVKLPITVHVREQRDGEQHVSTREGITPVKPDDLIMRGVAGEEYPIGRELFEKTYRIGDLAEPETAEPVAWQRRYILPDGPYDWQDCAPEDVEYYRSGVELIEVRPLYTRPPRDEWRPASEPPEDLRGRVIAWRHPPQRQGGAWIEALYDDGAWVTRDGIAHDITHWRDVTPPTTEGE